MSDIPFQRIISCTSEDVGYEAKNLLNPSIASGKWRCKVGEKNASVVLQLQRSEKIGKIDIGNNGSAFVEVLVGLSSGSLDQFSVILPSSSFMSPAECKVQSGGNMSRVRMFGPEKLTKPICESSWDLIKVVCTQPFNKSIPFGVSFIKLYAPSNSKEVDKDKEEQGPFINSSANSVSSRPDVAKKCDSPSQPKISASNSMRPTKRVSSPDAYQCDSKKAKTDEKSSDVGGKPLNGVVFVLSGFQNPERSDLRSKAIKLGAKYEADWSDNCTHLICAFANTPKFNQVKGRGKIISKKWIEDCHEKKALLDWRKYDMCSGQNTKASNSLTHSRELPESEKDVENSADNLTANLPNIYSSKSFHIHSNISPTQSAKLKRLIVTFGGTLLSKVSSATDFVIAEDGDDIASLENDHPEVTLVRPEWIFACQRKKKFLPFEQFTVSST